MAQHIDGLAVIGGILAAALSKQMADEFKAWTPWLIKRLLDRAVSILPDKRLRDRFAEEWASYISEIPGEVGKILGALGLLRAAEQVRFYFLVSKAKSMLQQQGLVEMLETFVLARLELKQALNEWKHYGVGFNSKSGGGASQYTLLPLPTIHSSYAKRSARG
jgi:hypothetical protein